MVVVNVAARIIPPAAPHIHDVRRTVLSMPCAQKVRVQKGVRAAAAVGQKCARATGHGEKVSSPKFFFLFFPENMNNSNEKRDRRKAR